MLVIRIDVRLLTALHAAGYVRDTDYMVASVFHVDSATNLVTVDITKANYRKLQGFIDPVKFAAVVELVG